MFLSAIWTTKPGSSPQSKGIAAAEHGEFIEEEEMDTRIERRFKR
jgi:predicted transcriptional regulator